LTDAEPRFIRRTVAVSEETALESMFLQSLVISIRCETPSCCVMERSGFLGDAVTLRTAAGAPWIRF
jgi:hypothetical protein